MAAEKSAPTPMSFGYQRRCGAKVAAPVYGVIAWGIGTGRPLAIFTSYFFTSSCEATADSAASSAARTRACPSWISNPCRHWMLSLKQNVCSLFNKNSPFREREFAELLKSKCLRLSVSGRVTERLSFATIYLPGQAIGFSSFIFCRCVASDLC